MNATGASEYQRPAVIPHFPCDVLSISGSDAVDYLQRITTNDLAEFAVGQIRKTLLVSDKGRIIDAVWVIRDQNHLLMIVGRGMAGDVQSFLEKYIVMDDVAVSNISDEYSVDLYFDQSHSGYHTDFFGFDAVFTLHRSGSGVRSKDSFVPVFEEWRIEHGIPQAGKEIVQDFNPLELDLWNWISFTKGCYIGQEVIARLDTYSKIQRTLCSIESAGTFAEGDILVDDSGAEIGRITTAFTKEQGSIGLCVIRIKHAVIGTTMKIKMSGRIVTIRNVFRKEGHGRN